MKGILLCQEILYIQFTQKIMIKSNYSYFKYFPKNSTTFFIT